MCFHSDPAGCPITWKCLLLILPTSARDTTFKGPFSISTGKCFIFCCCTYRCSEFIRSRGTLEIVLLQNIIKMNHNKIATLLKLIPKNSENRTVNVSFSFNLHYCLHAKHEERNTRGMLSGIVLHFFAQTKSPRVTAISRGTSNPFCVSTMARKGLFPSQITPSFGASHEEIK